MTPGAPAAARPGGVRPLRPPAAPEAAPGARPPLRVLEPARRQRRRRRRRAARLEVWAAATMVVGSLLAVVVGDAVVAQGQIRLTRTQHAIAVATATEKAEQVRVAEEAAPPVVVRAAERLGLVAPASIVDLPSVPLDVPLPAPDTSSGSTSTR